MFDSAAADRAERFIGGLTHTKGRWAGRRFDLLPWQRDEIIRPLFGTLRPDGYRRYKTCYAEIPKKNGKSELAAAIALYLLFADGEMGAEIYSAAADREQASIVFNVAAQMVRNSPALTKRSKIVYSQKRIVVPGTGSFYRALSAEAYTKHGFNVHGVIFDELHIQPDRKLWDVMTVGAGDARTQPLTFAITTAGFDRHSICWEVHEYADKILRAVLKDPTFLPVIHAAPEDADWEDPKVWKACNPSLGMILSMEKIEDAYRQAKATPAQENTFRRLRLNQWVRQETRWIRMKDWDASAGQVDAADLEGRRCYAGLDMASTIDVAALVLVFPPEEGEEDFQVLPYFWVPEDTMAERVARDHVPYDLWVKDGDMTATEGNVTDYATVMADIGELSKRFNICEIAYDRWGAIQLVQDLEADGATVVPFGQGFASMSAPSKELEKLVLSRQIRHGGHPVLRWMADNVMVRQDPAGNIKPDKAKSTEKIDGIVALIMALDRAIRHEEEGPSVYETRGILTV